MVTTWAEDCSGGTYSSMSMLGSTIGTPTRSRATSCCPATRRRCLDPTSSTISAAWRFPSAIASEVTLPELLETRASRKVRVFIEVAVASEHFVPEMDRLAVAQEFQVVRERRVKCRSPLLVMKRIEVPEGLCSLREREVARRNRKALRSILSPCHVAAPV